MLCALAWLHPALREAVGSRMVLYAGLALTCGFGSAVLKQLAAGTSRKIGIWILLILCFGLVVGWHYVELTPVKSFSLFEATADALGEVILPMGIVVLLVSGLPETRWPVVKVASLVLATAPFSSLLGLAVSVLILREGP